METAAGIIKRKYEHPEVVEKYASHAKDIGLWESEKIIYPRYLKHGSVLDIGCGAGRVTFPLAEMGYSVTGLDHSGAMIDHCRQEAKNRSSNIAFICADAAAMPFEDARFASCIFSYNGLMTVPGRQKRLDILREIYRVLQEDGTFIFTTHLRSSQTESRFTDYWEEEKELWDSGRQDSRLVDFGDVIFPAMNNREVEGFVHIPTVEEVEDDLAATGFEVLFADVREHIAAEAKLTLKVTNECVFWVVSPTADR